MIERDVLRGAGFHFRVLALLATVDGRPCPPAAWLRLRNIVLKRFDPVVGFRLVLAEDSPCR